MLKNTFNKKRILSLLLTAIMVSSSIVPVYADEVTEINWGSDEETIGSVTTADAAKDLSKTYLALGADLTQEQLATVLSLMGLTATDVSNCNVVYITNADEKNYLGNYVDPSVIGSRALSSVLVRPASSGHGIQVKTQNITYCTQGMYMNALLTAGVKDADILVVGPTPISGTAALIGALKAYEEMSGKDVTEQAVDTALDELVTTGEIAEAIGESDEVSELIAFVKAEIAGKNLNTEEEIEAVVRQAADDYGTNLTEEEISQIVSLMLKINELGLDYNSLLDQAEDLYKKFGKDISLEDLSKVSDLSDIADLTGKSKGEVIKYVIGNFFTSVFDGITKFVKGIFG